MFNFCQKLYTVKDLANLFGVSEQSIRLWVKGGRLKALRVGRSCRFTADAIEAFLTKNNGAEV